MPTIFELDAGDHLCPYNSFAPCFGAKCMAFGWIGPQADRCETDNLVDTPEGLRPNGSPPAPDGEGWEMDGAPYSKGYHRSEKEKLPKATAQRWVKARPRAQGQCTRAGGDTEWSRW